MDTPKVISAIGRTDSLNFPLMSSPSQSAFAPVNPTDEQGISRVFGSLGYIFRPQASQDGSIGGLLTLNQHDTEERKRVMEEEKPRNGGITAALQNSLDKQYFGNSGMFSAGHNDNQKQKN
jgi:hypothetical protein